MSLYVRNSILVTSYTWSRGRLLKWNSIKYTLISLEGSVVMLKSYYPHILFDCDHYLFLEVSQYKILSLWLSITLILVSKIHALKRILLTCNIWKHPQSEHKGNHKWKQKEKLIDHGVQCLHLKKKKRIERWYHIKKESSCAISRLMRSC